jgi:transcriptional regulator with XRE-family HTH domain
MTTIHYKLKLLRQKHALTQIQVAEKLNCSVPAYSKMETGSTDITDYRLTQLAELYQLRVSEIYEFGEPCNNEQLHIIEKLREDASKNASVISNLQRKVIELYEEKYQRPGV